MEHEPRQNHRFKRAGGTGGRRALVVAGRWSLVVAGTASILLGFGATDPVERSLAFALLSFLLANALWQHTALKRACAGAAAASILVGIALSLLQAPPAHAPTISFLAAIGGLVGAVVAYPVLQRIDRFSNAR